MDRALPDSSGEDERIVLNLLNSVDDGAQSQRRIAEELGIALGLVNAYLKRCIKKGLVKVSQAPARRYAYYLTPKGFAEKSRLTMEYLSSSFSFFRQAKADCAQVLQLAKAQQFQNLVLCGRSDLAEIALLSAVDCGVTNRCNCPSECGRHSLCRDTGRFWLRSRCRSIRRCDDHRCGRSQSGLRRSGAPLRTGPCACSKPAGPEPLRASGCAAMNIIDAWYIVRAHVMPVAAIPAFPRTSLSPRHRNIVSCPSIPYRMCKMPSRRVAFLSNLFVSTAKGRGAH
ncbi:winged helix-turn-helix transcriptional regulator [Bradyrhizobium sp. JR3.5]